MFLNSLPCKYFVIFSGMMGLYYILNLFDYSLARLNLSIRICLLLHVSTDRKVSSMSEASPL